MKYLDLKIALYLVPLVLATNFATANTEDAEAIFSLSLEELLAIKVISPSKRPQKLSDAPGTVYVITEQDILIYGYRDLKDALKTVPGMEISWSGFFMQGGQRGFARSFAETLLLVNGREVQSLFTGEMFVSKQFPLHNVERIEIMQGPASALYGANAYLGVINIITKVENPQYSGGELGIRSASWNTKEYYFNYAGHLMDDRLRIAVSGREYRSDEEDFTDFIDDPKFVPNYFDTDPEHFPSAGDSENPYASESFVTNISAKVSFNLSDMETFYAGIDRYDNDGGVGLQWGPQTWAKRVIEGTWDQRIQRMQHIGYNGKFMDNRVDFTFEYQSWREDILEGQQGYDWDTNELNRWDWNTTNLKRRKLFAQIGFDFTLGENKNHLITGIAQDNFNWTKSRNGWNYDFIDNGASVLAEARGLLSNDKSSFYFQNQTSIGEEWLLSLGGRFDDQSLHGSTFNPRVALIYKMDEKTTWKFLYGQAFREPSGFELMFVKENLPIPSPSEMTTYEISWQRGFSKFNIHAVLFLNQSSDIIIENEQLARAQYPEITDFGGGDRYFINANDRDTKGVEISLNIIPTKRLTGFVNWSYVSPDAEIAFAGSPQEKAVKGLNIAKNKLNLGLSYQLTDTITLSLLDHWRSSVVVDRPGVRGGDNLLTSLDAYHDTSLTLSSRNIGLGSGTKANVSLVLNNLFDREFYQPSVRDDAAVYLQEGRSVSLQIALKF